ncbi:hypothetical protein [Tenacibaculum jejuense]|uniref:Lipoprotein n=1 Tax=Tenacibaculum jejuense TaxID=584609 RepID=A0A238U8N9_9FLAO|nr:hypothetical protein [Tenacibaculum jejuense]SNR15356.1 Protein of unknown function precursor [Tenacibaculum jejuense]
MKNIKYLFFFILCISSITTEAQVFPGSPVSGFPSGTTAQITSVASPVEATIAYSTDEKIFYYYDGTNWIALRSDPNVFVGSFIITAPGGTTATSFNVNVNTLPFRPSQITFNAHANIEAFNINAAGSAGLNTPTLQNAFGVMQGYARNDAGTTTQATIYIGGSGSSINSISRYSSNSQCIGLRYGNQNAVNMGVISGTLSSFDLNGFTINVSYTLGTSGNTNRDNDILDESLVVFFTAYR